MNNLLSARGLSNEFVTRLIATTNEICQNGFDPNYLNGKIIATLFLEPSTRTRLSFEAAALRQGGKVISAFGDMSSLTKGESIEDTVQVLSSYCDLIVLRSANRNDCFAPSAVPIINAGNDSDEHPTQALVDLFTMHHKFSAEKTTNIVFVGDLKYSRPVHSLCYLLSEHYFNTKLHFVHSDGLNFVSDTISSLPIVENIPFIDALQLADVVYMTRVQRKPVGQIYREPQYVLTEPMLQHLKQDAIIMHPLPRNEEIHPAVDSDHRAIYFTQAKNGLYVRMAILQDLLSSV